MVVKKAGNTKLRQELSMQEDTSMSAKRETAAVRLATVVCFLHTIPLDKREDEEVRPYHHRKPIVCIFVLPGVDYVPVFRSVLFKHRAP